MMGLQLDGEMIMSRRECSSRPRMLKDFLRDDGCSSSNGFPMYPRFKSTAKSNKPPIVLLRSLSKKTKISAIVKLLQFAASMRMRSPSPRKLNRKEVKVKDILRWRSFKDTVEENSPPLDRSTTTTAAAASSCSSWCHSDFTEEGLPPWNYKVFEESEQKSPVSVLDSPFRKVEDFMISPLHPILAKINPRAECNYVTHCRGEVSYNSGATDIAVEEKAKQLLSCVKMNIHVNADEVAILDFFMQELSINGKLQDDEFQCKILKVAKSWIDGEFDESYEWEVESKRGSYVKDMGWDYNFKHGKELEGVSKELEMELLDDMIHDLVIHFLTT